MLLGLSSSLSKIALLAKTTSTKTCQPTKASEQLPIEVTLRARVLRSIRGAERGRQALLCPGVLERDHQTFEILAANNRFRVSTQCNDDNLRPL